MTLTPSVGYFPATWPKDPVLVSNFYEHTLMGQVTEPLVACASDGTLRASIADSWRFSADGMTINFGIRAGLSFADGRPVRAEDVKATLERHITSGVSQSLGYLERIASIDVTDNSELRINLRTPYVAMAKALSRDQLGILPADWTYDSRSADPYVGTGAYRAIKDNGGSWLFEANPRYRGASEVGVKRWRIIRFDPANVDFAQLELPDLIPVATPALAIAIESHPQFEAKAFKKTRLNHFTQFGAWWYPHGRRKDDVAFQKRSMSAVRELLASCAGDSVTTGVFPEGIAGHLAKSPAAASSDDFRQSRVEEIMLAVSEREAKLLAEPQLLAQIEARHKVCITVQPVPLTEFGALKTTKPDVFCFQYAGGFADPEGFLVVLTAMLHADMATILASEYPRYVRASSETNELVRAQLYRELNHGLVAQHLYAPGWRPELYEYVRHSLLTARPVDGFTRRLKDFCFAGDGRDE